MKMDYKPLVILTAIMAICATQIKAEPKQPEKAVEAPTAGSFDALYKLRIDYFTKSVTIYESVKDEATAKKAAADLLGLSELTKKIDKMSKELGQPDAAAYAELNKKYGNQLAALSTKMMKASYAISSKPYSRHLQMAQLQMMADAGDKEAAQALKMMKNPEAMKELEEKQRAEKERAEKDISPEARKAGDEWIAALQAVQKELNGLKDEAAAKKALPKLKTLVADLEAKADATKKAEGAANYIFLNRQKLLSSVMAISQAGAKFEKTSDKELQAVMNRLFQQINH